MDDDRELIARYRQTRDPDSFRTLGRAAPGSRVSG
jgi:hypothetical protein